MRNDKNILSLISVSILIFVFAVGSVVFAHPHKLTPESALEAVNMNRVFLEENPDDYMLRFDIGEKLMIASKLDESEKELEIVVETDPEFAIAWVRLAEVQYFRKDYKRAVRILEKFRSDDEIDRYEYLVLKTSILIELEKYKEALKAAKEAAAIDQSWFYQPDARGVFYEAILKKATGDSRKPVQDVVESLNIALKGFFAVEWYSNYIERFFSREEYIDILKMVHSECYPDTPLAKQIDKKILELQKD